MIKRLSNENGQVFVLAIVVVGIVLISTLLTVAGAQIYHQNTNYSLEAEKATALAEAGIDKAIVSLNKSGGGYSGENETFLGDGSYSVAITTKDAATQIITATGYIPNRTNPKTKRAVSIQASKGLGVSFAYGMQIGEGGLAMGNGSTLNGSIYSNGDITGGNNNRINGDAWVAGGTVSVADVQNDCTSSCQDYIFGKTVGGEGRRDVAQNFRPSISGVLNKVSLKLKKNGLPADLIVKIASDNSGKPDKDNILLTGTLPASRVADNYGFVDVSFTSSGQLEAGITYWIVVRAQSLDNSNYWYWYNDIPALGVASWSANWQASNPTWTTISGSLDFKTFMGGTITSISMDSGSVVADDVHANTISGITVNGDAYYQTITNSTVNGTSYPNSADPPPAVFPISAANIEEWEDAAFQAGVSTGNIVGGNSCSLNLGPGKIEGNLILGNSCIVTVQTPIWITGNITAGNSVVFRLDPTFAGSSGVIIVDGTVTLGNGSDFRGSGTDGSYLMLLSNYDSRTNNTEAITTGNSSFSGIFYAPYGIVELANGASFREISAWKLELGNSSVLNYQTGLANLLFSGPSLGSYTLVKGTYQIK